MASLTLLGVAALALVAWCAWWVSLLAIWRLWAEITAHRDAQRARGKARRILKLPARSAFHDPDEDRAS